MLTRIVRVRPPYWNEILTVFPSADRPGIIFAWGDRVYMPNGGQLTAALAAHERVHMKRQGADVEGWWKRYLVDPAFRLAEELPAHRAEYEWYASQADANDAVPGWRSRKDLHLQMIAQRLASPLYGRMLSSTGAAKKAILAAA